MDSTRLTDEHRQRLVSAITRHLDYYHRLIQRMQQRQFPLDDSLWLHACRCRDDVRELLSILRSRRRRQA